MPTHVAQAVPRRVLMVLLALGGALAATVGGVGSLPSAEALQRRTDDTTWVVDDVRYPDPVEVARRLSRLAFEGQSRGDGVARVVLARADGFADALAAGSLLGDGPLLLVPGRGPVPDGVVAEIRRTAPQEVVVLGGEAAISAAVVDEVAALGTPVRRLAGRSRIETAVLAAGDSPAGPPDGGPGGDPVTVLLVRADAGDSADPTAAFADALGVAAWAAETGWPVLLTPSHALPGLVADHLTSRGVGRVVVVGGPAAVGPGVVAAVQALDIDVDRIAGPSRVDTAVAVAEARGVGPDDGPGHVVLVEGHLPDAWAGGLAAAALAARDGAPVLVADGPDVPAAVLRRIAAGHTGQVGLACVALPVACEAARAALGMPPLVRVGASLPDGAPARPGQVVTFSRPDGLAGEVIAVGTCLSGPVAITGAAHEVGLAPALPSGTCTLGVDVHTRTADGAPGPVQRDRRLHPTIASPADGRPTFVAIGEADPTILARTLVADDVVILHARRTGDPRAVGLVADATTLVGADHGVVLSTGRVRALAGPNGQTATTTDLGTPGDPRLAPLAAATQDTDTTVDAAVLEVDLVVPRGRPAVSVGYTFGSEEYEEFDDTRGDVLSVEVDGVGCAWLDGLPVNAATVGPGRNAEAYRSNVDGVLDVELDGLTSGLVCTAAVPSRGVTRVRVAIADVGDPLVDSAVILAGDALGR